MKWNEVKVATASEAVEAVANILMEQRGQWCSNRRCS